MKNKNFEITKVVILNEQLGSPKDLELKVVENSLSDEDKYDIKQAVLKAVGNGCSDPEMLASRCCSAIEIINKNGLNTGNGSVSTSSNSA
ncbi:hypothetical protein MHD_04505 [Mannheimia granulomatis]|uniref:hypothetical protein n=1 Tax=Mannheimia granulomatis TaxID=85402 RepID=UPI0005B354E0|nr:hypothetical protein [Mannheimia granulomatis]RGE48384.1 hypothetical protein MHD_04505 [Mannheimia granulomatis]